MNKAQLQMGYSTMGLLFRTPRSEPASLPVDDLFAGLTEEYRRALESALSWNRDDCRKMGLELKSSTLRTMDKASARFICNGQKSGTAPDALLRSLASLREEEDNDGHNWQADVEAETRYSLMAGVSKKQRIG